MLNDYLFQVIFITEYMSSGSLKQFLKRTKRNVKKPPLQAWKRWCTQILSALRWSLDLIFFFLLKRSLNWNPLSSGSFLHSCSPPIVHGNLTCDTIFIQHNGLIKIGSGLCELKHWACHYLTIIFLTFLNSCPRCYSPARQDLPRGNEKYPFYCSGIRKWV